MAKRYPYQWARTVFENFMETYSRGFKLFQEIHGTTESEAILWLQTDQAKWEEFKKKVKFLQN